MDPFVGAILFAAGASVGSFLNVLVWRLPRAEPILSRPSRCQACSRRLGVVDLLPVAGFFLCGARCRSCRAGIDRRYPAVEAGAGVAAVAVVAWGGFTVESLRVFALGAALFTAAEIDRRHGIIPDRLLLGSGGLGLLLAGTVGIGALGHAVVAALGAGGAVWMVRAGSRLLFGRHGLGMGDVKLAAVTGLYIGWAGLVVFYGAALLGGGVGLAGLLTGRLQPSSRMPFAPFVAAAAALYATGFLSFVSW